MRALDDIDSAAQLFRPIASDPGFYEAKAYLRYQYPDNQLIEILPGDLGMMSCRIIHGDGEITEVLI